MLITDKIQPSDILTMISHFSGSVADIFQDMTVSFIPYNFIAIAHGIQLNSIFDDVTASVLLQIVADKNNIKWKHLADLFLKDYNPIENYSMVENMLDYQQEGKTESGAENYHEKTTEKSAVGANVKQGKQVSSVNVSESESNIITEDGVNIKSKNYNTTMDDTDTERLHDAQTSEGTTATESMQGGFRDFTIQGKKIQEKSQIAHEGTGININDSITNQDFDVTGISGHKGNRSGNIGVTTTQQMGESEIIYAQKLVLVDIIMRDITDFLSAGVYV